MSILHSYRIIVVITIVVIIFLQIFAHKYTCFHPTKRENDCCYCRWAQAYLKHVSIALENCQQHKKENSPCWAIDTLIKFGFWINAWIRFINKHTLPLIYLVLKKSEKMKIFNCTQTNYFSFTIL